MLTVLDLFSGIGGFSLGLERTGGFKTIQFCEVDEQCQRVLSKHWEHTPIHGDVTTMVGAPADVICGGFPCQDISVAGKGAGVKEGSRSGLWSEFHRLIKEIKPKYAIIENVANLRNNGLERVLKDLWEIGYDAEWHIIPASSVGAPHKRERIWIIAYPQRERQQPPQYEVLGVWDTKRCKEMLFAWNGAEKFTSENVEVRDSGGGRPTQVKSSVRRVNDGVQRRLDRDRLKQIGNSIMPQIAEVIGHSILQHVLLGGSR